MAGDKQDRLCGLTGWPHNNKLHILNENWSTQTNHCRVTGNINLTSINYLVGPALILKEHTDNIADVIIESKRQQRFNEAAEMISDHCVNVLCKVWIVRNVFNHMLRPCKPTKRIYTTPLLYFYQHIHMHITTADKNVSSTSSKNCSLSYSTRYKRQYFPGFIYRCYCMQLVDEYINDKKTEIQHVTFGSQSLTSNAQITSTFCTNLLEM